MRSRSTGWPHERSAASPWTSWTGDVDRSQPIRARQRRCRPIVRSGRPSTTSPTRSPIIRSSTRRHPVDVTLDGIAGSTSTCSCRSDLHGVRARLLAWEPDYAQGPSDTDGISGSSMWTASASWSRAMDYAGTSPQHLAELEAIGGLDPDRTADRRSDLDWPPHARRPVAPCTTSAHGSIPPQRHTQHRAPGRQPLRRGAVRRRGLHRPQLAALPPGAADADAPDRAGRGELELEAADDGLHRHRLTKTGGVEPQGDADHRPGPAVLQQRRRLRASSGRPRRCPRPSSTATAIADEMLFVHEGDRRAATRSSGRCATARATTSSCRSARPGGSTPDDGQRAADAVPRGAVRDRAAEALPQRLRPAARALAVLAARPPRARRRPGPDRRGRLRHPRPLDATGSPPTTTATTRSTSSAGTATSGRSAFNIADFQPITGRVHQPPPVHQTFQARNFVVCSFVPRKFDYHPLAIPAPYNHSNINSDEVIYYVAGNFMSRRGRGDRLVHAPPGRASRTARTRARSRRRSARRRPRSWR